jgi:hypothetical protein
MSAASSSKKRARDLSSDGDAVKKAKYTLNTTMPPDLDFIEPAAPGSLRFMTWNVNVAPKGRPVNPDFIRYCKKENADVVCLTEIRSCPDTVLADTYRVRLLGCLYRQLTQPSIATSHGIRTAMSVRRCVSRVACQLTRVQTAWRSCPRSSPLP